MLTQSRSQIERPLHVATVWVGELTTAAAYKSAMRKAGCVINPDHVETVLSSAEPGFLQERTAIDLYRICGWAVGATAPTGDLELFTRFTAAGFELCPVDAALAYRVDYRKQPVDECLLVAMTMFEVTKGARVILDITHLNGKPRLDVRLLAQTRAPDQDYLVMKRQG
jgi:hypothetical protein